MRPDFDEFRDELDPGPIGLALAFFCFALAFALYAVERGWAWLKGGR